MSVVLKGDVTTISSANIHHKEDQGEIPDQHRAVGISTALYQWSPAFSIRSTLTFKSNPKCSATTSPPTPKGKSEGKEGGPDEGRGRKKDWGARLPNR